MTRSRYRALVAYATASARAFAHWSETGFWSSELAERERFAHGRLPHNTRAMVLAPQHKGE